MEVKNVSTRRKNATAAAKRSGKWNGNIVPFGFYKTKVDGEEVIKPSPFEQTVLRECYRCWLAGWSCYELKLALANRGIQRNGKFWDSLQLIDAIKQMHEEKKRLGLLEAIK